MAFFPATKGAIQREKKKKGHQGLGALRDVGHGQGIDGVQKPQRRGETGNRQRLACENRSKIFPGQDPPHESEQDQSVQ